MEQRRKHTFVLVAGAWYGGWVWRDVVLYLRERGHSVSTVTLTGLGERQHLGNKDINLSVHIEDVISHIQMEGLTAVTLVGWSYGGAVVTGVAKILSGSLKSIIYLDAFAPETGKTVADYLPLERRVALENLLNSGKTLPPMPLEAFGVTDRSIIDYVMPRLTPHPLATYFEAASGSEIEQSIGVTYIYCTGYGEKTTFTQFYERLRRDTNIKTAEIEAGHLCMLSNVAETADKLILFA
jgi:pimeloyl-ACP methyl ester carboxylesterase